MCGRFSLGGHSHAEIQQLDGYNVEVGEWINQDRFIPRYNIAPRSQAPVLRRRHAGTGSAEHGEPSDQLILHTMKWGVVPHWSKHEDASMRTINARSENLIEGGGMWASLKGKKRCAVPCEGYYEWLKKGKERSPYFTRRQDNKLMMLAGLYDVAHLEGETEPLWTFTIVTTDANKEFNWLHDRQPVILSSEQALKTWLDTSSRAWTPELTKLLDPYRDDNSPLICYQVPKEVGKVGTESPTFIQPIAERKDGIQAMFAKQKAATREPPLKSPRSGEKKRKRSASPSTSAEVSKSDKGKKPKTENLNTWEDDSDIECIDNPNIDESEAGPEAAASTKEAERDNMSPSSNQKAKRGKSSKPSSPKKAKKVRQSNKSEKITAFFPKP